MFDLNKIIRENIKKLIPYSSARNEFKGEANIFLDANENAYGSPLEQNFNRYPDPLQLKLKEKISKVKGVPAKNIFLGNGSDEVIDILYRAFCNPAKDNAILCPPTYGMFEVSANINDVEVRKVQLTAEFQLNAEGISENVDENTKLIFLCSPNNPTGNSLDREDIEFILNNFSGIVVIDEAYINFSKQKSFTLELNEYPNLVVMQTLSKAWGMAGLRIGMAFASEEIISVFNKIKPPYNINEASQQLAIKALDNIEQVNNWIKEIVSEREKLVKSLADFSFVKKIFPSDANFLLVKTTEPKKIYNYLVGQGIIIRDRSNISLCEGCLRITVGTKEENKKLIQALNQYK
ncbi:MAG: histidinol-phosphate transaminase [Bacteroidetes bacterium]|nr:histidinol-phosphate transaminase [Bacteroidota bacterium]